VDLGKAAAERGHGDPSGRPGQTRPQQGTGNAVSNSVTADAGWLLGAQDWAYQWKDSADGRRSDLPLETKKTDCHLTDLFYPLATPTTGSQPQTADIQLPVLTGRRLPVQPDHLPPSLQVCCSYDGQIVCLSITLTIDNRSSYQFVSLIALLLHPDSSPSSAEAEPAASNTGNMRALVHHRPHPSHCHVAYALFLYLHTEHWHYMYFAMLAAGKPTPYPAAATATSRFPHCYLGLPCCWDLTILPATFNAFDLGGPY
jgi:hypothetical protein